MPLHPIHGRRKVITLCAKNIGQKFINVAERCYRRKHQRLAVCYLKKGSR